MLSDQGHRAGGRRHLIEALREPDGTVRLRGEPLQPHAPTLVALLDDAARRAPDRAFIIERDGRGVWRELTFVRAAERARRVAAGLRAAGASPLRPVVLLDSDGVEDALVMLGAWCAAIPVVPLDARSRLAHLRAIVEHVRPGVVFARDGALLTGAVRELLGGAACVSVSEPRHDGTVRDFARLLAYEPLAGAPAIDGESVAAIAFTAGPRGEPRGVVTTHAMLCAQQQALAQAWPFLAGRAPVLVQPPPWHTALGATAFGIALRHAGTLAVDAATSAASGSALREEIAPTLAFDVPAGWDAWTRRLRSDDALRRRWLAALDRACWSGALLAPATRDALRAMRVPLAGLWGAKATAGAVAVTPRIDPRHDALGAPLPGVELKLVPCDGGYDARVRGPQVMPGYYWLPEETAAAFDDEGFYRTGDIVRAVDARAPERGLAFVARGDARFTLASGAWVRADALRAAFLAGCPDAADVVADGAGSTAVALLVWPSAQGRALPRDVLRAQIAAAMRLTTVDEPAARPRRALIVDDPHVHEEPVRARLLARLHASEPDAEVIVA